ncbi:MAG: TIGR00268 family protein [Deltaproteobacteria bacterium RIFCSPLOWO2_12_FULL_44_12]|nr:MAG: TIGR00268 family protein [Deltaproteobacteria bacterium RIFCSPHIGHO2_01_FULL_43_49]OGQ14194.1 MAG: TIGR00268 family protein [Deltaproteobacteria bacterium RIFCSPHIGHO2_02_FULL_44_53]OGQ27410.1 MAG: TIGR00268 family protein [Deltaproteobacteria bacterium RIFCSPHIGHO2_12_FULL_44_21]OGQ30658.1 MAG: TIGR00268 family protein [Deltaproteobacteria bacterium RIFCSPLOWO2_01_FULL_45_74]OGQ42336.1 MAG: TIGR00268 family protein [Deltaproteobacteria bacterium RIFCSPLOWO2_02_FULL_44_34]OGQ69245.1 MA
MKQLLELENYIQNLKRAVVAFSGGVDSAFLAFLARKTLGKESMVAITGDSASVPSRDREFVSAFCQKYDIPHEFILTYEYDNPSYRSNPENRCFFCKEELYQKLKGYAESKGFKHVLDGTNMTDLKGHRPGFEALKKAGILAPYIDLEIEKTAIRKMADSFNLEVATKPQSACLASRVPTGTPIDVEALQRIDAAENFLKDLGVREPRVRFHGDLARLQLKKEEWLLCIEVKEKIQKQFQSLGFKFVTLDLKEYDREG